MGWFSKKKEVEEQGEVPKLPELPEQSDLVLPSKADFTEPSNKELPEIGRDRSMLPELPEPKFEYPEPMEKPTTKPQEMQKSKFAPLPKPIIKKPEHEIYERPKYHEPMLPTQPPKIKSKPIYVRLDKFETTEESLDEIKKKIIEIEGFLKKIKEIKAQEEKELDDWERELQIIKTRIESIDRNIFSKLD